MVAVYIGDQPLRCAASAQAVFRGDQCVSLLHGLRIRRQGRGRASGGGLISHHDRLVGAAVPGARASIPRWSRSWLRAFCWRCCSSRWCGLCHRAEPGQARAPPLWCQGTPTCQFQSTSRSQRAAFARWSGSRLDLGALVRRGAYEADADAEFAGRRWRPLRACLSDGQVATRCRPGAESTNGSRDAECSKTCDGGRPRLRQPPWSGGRLAGCWRQANGWAGLICATLVRRAMDSVRDPAGWPVWRSTALSTCPMRSEKRRHRVSTACR